MIFSGTSTPRRFLTQPLTKRDLKLSETVHHLFDSGQLQGLFHLLNDERPITGLGQTEFTRGVLWINALETGGEAVR